MGGGGHRFTWLLGNDPSLGSHLDVDLKTLFSILFLEQPQRQDEPSAERRQQHRGAAGVGWRRQCRRRRRRRLLIGFGRRDADPRRWGNHRQCRRRLAGAATGRRRRGRRRRLRGDAGRRDAQNRRPRRQRLARRFPQGQRHQNVHPMERPLQFQLQGTGTGFLFG